MLMATERMRALEFEGRRRGINLDQGTWQAIDWLADQKGVKWAELAREWLMIGTRGPQKDDNLTRIIRSSAMAALLNETIFAERAEMYASAGPIQMSMGQCSDQDFEHALEQCQRIEFQNDDFGGFGVTIGNNEFGKATIYIKNQLKFGSNLIISLPISAEEWAELAEGLA
jgi:predicted DNA-binding ribbon-helix-helix protein